MARRQMAHSRVARWISERMEERDWNQLTVAHHCGISHGYLNTILHRGRLPTDDKIERLALAFGVASKEPLVLLYADRIERVLATAPPRVAQHLRPAQSAVDRVTRGLRRPKR